MWLICLNSSAASSEGPGSNTLGSVRCGFVDSTVPSFRNVTKTSLSYISTTTTNAILSQSNGFSSTTIQNTPLGSTMRSVNMSDSTQQSILSLSETQKAASSSPIVPAPGDSTPALASQTEFGKKSISTGMNHHHAYS